MDNGIFTVSLDFELYWGVRDKRSIEDYRENLEGARRAIPRILELFEKYGIHATWATVGFLFFNDADELKANLPDVRPQYEDPNLCPYKYIEEANELDPALHFAPDLIELIRNTPGQEIASHTFSHFYCQEPGQDAEAFRADVAAFVKTAASRDFDIESIVFARNQVNEDYLPILGEHGIRAYRGVETSWLHRGTRNTGHSLARRALRLVDAYVNLSGSNTHSVERSRTAGRINVPSSRFLRSYDEKLVFLDRLRRRRIWKAMEYAAKHSDVFHLWWHPHNFGVRTQENLVQLEKILGNYTRLKEQHAFESLSMGDIAKSVTRD